LLRVVLLRVELTTRVFSEGESDCLELPALCLVPSFTFLRANPGVVD
jgi:hypothetical protein